MRQKKLLVFVCRKITSFFFYPESNFVMSAVMVARGNASNVKKLTVQANCPNSSGGTAYERVSRKSAVRA